ncbi:MAG: hypothetical protein ABSG31_05870 [Tepidisphaeraceae bacterium]|jgi:uncharacterized membrane protein
MPTAFANLPLASATLRLNLISPWTALGLFIVLGGLIVLMGMRSLAGLGPVRKWVAIGTRLAVLLLLILILGDVKLVRRNTALEVMILRDISGSTDLVRNFPGEHLQSSLDDYLLDATSADKSASYKPGDKVGQISFNERPHIDAIPADHLTLDARSIQGPGTGTDIAAAIQLGLATMDPDSMHRLLLITDGNSTAGDLNAALGAASSQHVPIDVMPLQYNVQHETMMDKFVAPTWRQEGQPFTIEVHTINTNAVDVQADLSVTDNGKLMTLASGDTTERVTLRPGKNVERILVPPLDSGVHQFHSVISNVSSVPGKPGGPPEPGATDLKNKSADIFTFVNGQEKVLLVDNMDPEHQTDYAKFLRDALGGEQMTIVSIPPEEFPNNPVDLQAYSAVILANVPRGVGGLSDDQDKMLASYIHDTGGGLVMIGGPQTFGAGGWEGSQLEKELPVVMEIPAQRQIPKGALVLCMDPAEAPDGNSWGEQCAIKAAEALSSQDDMGMIDFSWSGASGYKWEAPLAPKGDGSKIIAAIHQWSLGDLPDFNQCIQLALDGDATSPGLIKSDARAKHIIIITDDDPHMPDDATIQRCIANKISISTITVYPHQPGNVAEGVRELAKRTGGRSYGPIESNPNQLPQIFIKEATVVKRTIVHEDPHGIPIRLAYSTSELVKGITAGDLPPLYGMDLTAKRDNPLVEMPITAGPKNDPVLAHWQAGLGKTAIYTGDAFNRWDANWVGTPMFAKFWSQVVRGVARSPVDPNFETDMTVDGDKGHIIVRALKEGDAFNNFLTIGGTIAGGADLDKQPIRLSQTGPGTYEADFDASQQGSYICYLSYSGEDSRRGSLLAGTVVNTSPEMRYLQSNDALLKQIADRTGGNYLAPFDVASADMFSRDGIAASESPQSIWDRLIPILLALILIDVAIRRIAWDWPATKRMALAVTGYIREFTTTYRKVEGTQTLASLKRVRDEVAEQKFKPAPTLVTAGSAEPRPNPGAKFIADKEIEGDIASVVGGATDKPIPSAPKRIQPKGFAEGDHTGGLLAAKRRAQEKIRQQQEDAPK